MSNGEVSTEVAGKTGLPPRRIGVGTAGVLSAVFAASLFVLIPVGLLIAPFGLVPVIQYQLNGERRFLGWAWVILVLAVLAAAGVPYTGILLVTYSVLIVVPCLSIDCWLRLEWDGGRWAAATTLIGTAICLLLVAMVVGPQTPVQGTAAAFEEAEIWPEEAKLDKMATTIGTSRLELELSIQAGKRWMSWIFPTFPIAYLVAVLFWVRPRLSLLGFPLPLAQFEEYRNDEWLPVAFLVAGLGTFIPSESGRWVAINLLMAVLILYFVQGLAIIRAHLARTIGRGFLVRWGVITVCLAGFRFGIPILVAILGLADNFVQMRPGTSRIGGKQ